MKTTEERALELFEKFPLACAVAKHEIIKEITLALKEEQKITRRGQEEEIMKSLIALKKHRRSELENHIESSIDQRFVGYDEVCNIIMNTRAT